ncbi:TRAP transporter small permease [Neobacillus mesonae]|uniref:TRAP transporter small permease n=1 Tax=Neobacillus mesonae TaxID=1193713 RepID=UPI00203F4A16|nr:TRAP transporter small permease [Neobacillus mesonae]MCM3569361.1 TRAP transporter small permease [Neobacillus mesonae]
MKWIEKLFEVLVAAILLLLTIVVSIQIFSRMLGSPFTWTEELSRAILIYASFLGGALAYYKGKGFKITLVTDKFPQKVRKVLDRVVLIASICLLTFVVYTSFLLINQLWDSVTPLMHLSKGILLISMPVGYFLIIIRLLKDFKSLNQPN